MGFKSRFETEKVKRFISVFIFRNCTCNHKKNYTKISEKIAQSLFLIDFPKNHVTSTILSPTSRPALSAGLIRLIFETKMPLEILSGRSF